MIIELATIASDIQHNKTEKGSEYKRYSIKIERQNGDYIKTTFISCADWRVSRHNDYKDIFEGDTVWIVGNLESYKRSDDTWGYSINVSDIKKVGVTNTQHITKVENKETFIDPNDLPF